MIKFIKKKKGNDNMQEQDQRMKKGAYHQAVMLIWEEDASVAFLLAFPLTFFSAVRGMVKRGGRGQTRDFVGAFGEGWQKVGGVVIWMRTFDLRAIIHEGNCGGSM